MLRLQCPAYRSIIGLTGGIGSGKSNALACLQEFGAVGVDADRLGHRVYEPQTAAYRAILEKYGDDVLSSTGSIDRKALGHRVFRDKEARAWLSGLVWPTMADLAVEEFTQQAAGRTDLVGVLEAAVLVEAKWHRKCDEVWMTYVPKEISLERVMARDGVTCADAELRMNAQMDPRQKRLVADVVVDTSGSKEETAMLLKQEWERLQQRLGPGQHD
jgi:phosphopantetheine adenylyltransferase/dephospho-CoA kinase